MHFLLERTESCESKFDLIFGDIINSTRCFISLVLIFGFNVYFCKLVKNGFSFMF